MIAKHRIPFMLLAFVNLLFGLGAGLSRIGLNFQLGNVVVHHGALMVGGFLGTLILLEKVVPLKNRALYFLPVVNALGILIVVPGFAKVGEYMLLIGAMSFVFVMLTYVRHNWQDLSLWVMLAGATFQVIGHINFMSDEFYPIAVPWWMGFLLFVITGERLELSKFLPVSNGAKLFLIAMLVGFLVGNILPFHLFGKSIAGLALTGIALWLMKYDIIGVSLRKDRLTRFSAIAILSACFWLLMTGVLLVFLPDLAFSYDIILHSFFLGFTFSMIFAHGPIILPGVLGLRIKPYHPILYVALFLLFVSLLTRILANILMIPTWRLISGWISATGILSYFVLLITLTVIRIKSEKVI